MSYSVAYKAPCELWNPLRKAVPGKFHGYGGQSKRNCLQNWVILFSGLGRSRLSLILTQIYICIFPGISQEVTVYPKKYAHGFCFAVLCCGYRLTDFPISTRLTSLALWQSNDCPSASKATLMNMDKYFMWIHYERLHNHNKAKHNKTVCIFLGIYCMNTGRYLATIAPLRVPECIARSEYDDLRGLKYKWFNMHICPHNTHFNPCPRASSRDINDA